jgi:hypothetical protein
MASGFQTGYETGSLSEVEQRIEKLRNMLNEVVGYTASRTEQLAADAGVPPATGGAMAPTGGPGVPRVARRSPGTPEFTYGETESHFRNIATFFNIHNPSGAIASLMQGYISPWTLWAGGQAAGQIAGKLGAGPAAQAQFEIMGSALSRAYMPIFAVGRAVDVGVGIIDKLLIERERERLRAAETQKRWAGEQMETALFTQYRTDRNWPLLARHLREYKGMMERRAIERTEWSSILRRTYSRVRGGSFDYDPEAEQEAIERTAIEKQYLIKSEELKAQTRIQEDARRIRETDQDFRNYYSWKDYMWRLDPSGKHDRMMYERHRDKIGMGHARYWKEFSLHMLMSPIYILDKLRHGENPFVSPETIYEKERQDEEKRSVEVALNRTTRRLEALQREQNIWHLSSFNRFVTAENRFHVNLVRKWKHDRFLEPARAPSDPTVSR